MHSNHGWVPWEQQSNVCALPKEIHQINRPKDRQISLCIPLDLDFCHLVSELDCVENC